MSISDHMLNKMADVYTKVKGDPNDFGETDFVLSKIISDIPIAFQVPISKREEELRFDIKGTTYVAKRIAYCNYRTDINDGDYLEVDSIKYLICSVQDNGGRGHHLRLLVTEWLQ